MSVRDRVTLQRHHVNVKRGLLATLKSAGLGGSSRWSSSWARSALFSCSVTAEFDIRHTSPQVARVLHKRLGLSLPAELRDDPRPGVPSDTSPPPQRTIHFGNGYSLGRLQIRDWDSPTWEWQDLGPAKGDVKVPAAKEAYLLLDPSAAQDLSILSELGPDDLQSMSMAATPVTDKQLEHLSGLTGLQTLDLRDTKITDAGLDRIAELIDARRIWLPNQISEQSRQELANALPKCKIA